MADTEHLFREQEPGEQEPAGIGTGRFKTAPDRAEKARYNMRVKTGRAEAGRVTAYAERMPRSAEGITAVTTYRKNGPQQRAYLSGVGALRPVSEPKEALKP